MNQVIHTRNPGSDFFAVGNECQQQHRRFCANEKITAMIEAIPDQVVVLNPSRQAVFANDAARTNLQIDAGQITGKSPGELFHCVNCAEHPGRCGSTSACQYCGMNRAFTQSRRNRRNMQDCVITTSQQPSHNFRVWAVPQLVENVLYSMMIIRDNRDAVDRDQLENLLTNGIRSRLFELLNLFGRARNEHMSYETLLDQAETVTADLNDALEEQMELQAAERGSLSPNPTGSCALRELNRTIETMTATCDRSRKRVILAGNSERVALRTDLKLLQRILRTMIGNALAATQPEEQVTVSCRRRGSQLEYAVACSSFLTEESQLRIFQRGVRLPGQEAGMGLYGARLIAEKYLGGVMTVKSDPSYGTTLKLSLPICYR